MAFLFLGARLVQIQALEAEKFKNLAADQRLRSIPLPALRGEVRDRTGSPMVLNIELATVFANPKQIKDKARAVRKLAPILEMKPEILSQKLIKNAGFVYLARQVPKATGEKVEKLDIHGLGVLRESRRFYPGGQLAAQVLGFTDIDNKGIAGLELGYNTELAGRPGEMLTELDPRGRSIPSGLVKVSSPVHGKSLELTLDRDIQFRAEQALVEAVGRYKSKWGTVLVMDPRNGEMLAMATVPGFDPNQPRTGQADIYRNRPVTDLYEPGSTLKSVMAVAALEAGVVDPNERFFLAPTIRASGRTIREAHRSRSEWFTFTEIITKSSNVGASTVAMRLGGTRLYAGIEKLGLLSRTGVDFPGEGAGYLLAPEKWSKVQLANVAFGQGVGVTPLALLQAIATVGNDGVTATPHLVRNVGTERRKTDPGRRVISSKTAQVATKILQTAVEKGTGGAARIAGYPVAGKTGTAQKAAPGGSGYLSGRYVASFVGFVPAQKPRLAILVVVDEPRPAYYGGVVAAPVFKEVAEFALRRLEIPPPALVPSP